MAMHAVAVVAKDRLWHEGSSLAGAHCGVFHRILENHQVISRSQQRIVSEVNFTLSSGCDLVMMALDRNPGLAQKGGDLGSQIRDRIQWRQRNITFLWSYVISVTV